MKEPVASRASAFLRRDSRCGGGSPAGVGGAACEAGGSAGQGSAVWLAVRSEGRGGARPAGMGAERHFGDARAAGGRTCARRPGLRREAWLPWCACLLLVFLPLLLSCGLPVEPGSDLPRLDSSGESTGESAERGESSQRSSVTSSPSGGVTESTHAAGATDTDALTGRFRIDAVLDSPVGDAVETAFLADVRQHGSRAQGEATLEMTLRSAEDPEGEGPESEEPAPVDEDGAFTARFRGFMIPAEFSDLLSSDTPADITLDGHVRSPECFDGEMRVVLVELADITLQGPFEAVREEAACDD